MWCVVPYKDSFGTQGEMLPFVVHTNQSSNDVVNLTESLSNSISPKLEFSKARVK